MLLFGFVLLLACGRMRHPALLNALKLTAMLSSGLWLFYMRLLRSKIDDYHDGDGSITVVVTRLRQF